MFHVKDSRTAGNSANLGKDVHIWQGYETDEIY